MELGKKVEVPHSRDRRKKMPGVSASIGGENNLLFLGTFKILEAIYNRFLPIKSLIIE